MKFLQKHIFGEKTIAVVDTAGGTRGRKFGIWHILRIVQIEKDVVYESCRTKGVKVLEEIEYDARSVRRASDLKSQMLERAAAMA